LRKLRSYLLEATFFRTVLLLKHRFCYFSVNFVQIVPFAWITLQSLKSMDYSSDEEENGGGFSILGHSISLKKRKRPDSPSSCSSSASSLRPARQHAPDLQSRNAAVRSWGNQPLHVADPEVRTLIDPSTTSKKLLAVRELGIYKFCVLWLYATWLNYQQ
jgi:hypothetical protein